MAADAYFSIGKTHTVCQDVARAGTTKAGQEYIIVCDGCSSSPRTELGAPILAAAFEHSIKQGGPRARLRRTIGEPCDDFPWEVPVVSNVLRRALFSVDDVGLPQHALDATLLYAHACNEHVHVEMWGDGAVLWRGTDGAETLITVEYDLGMPAYPSYLLSRAEDYLAQSNNGARTLVVYKKDQGAAWRRTVHHEQMGVSPVTTTIPRSGLDIVCLFSDGLASFQKRVGAAFEPVPVTDVVPYLVNVKVPTGTFVTRRLRRFLTTECRDLGWHHDDDLAVAAIKLEEGK